MALAQPAVLSALPDSIARPAALLEAAGFAVIEPLHPIRDVWHLVAHTAQHPGLTLVGVFATPPDPRSPRLGLPGGYHPGTRRLLEGRYPAARGHELMSDSSLPGETGRAKA